MDRRGEPLRKCFPCQGHRPQTEKQALAHLNLETARTWKIINPSVKMRWANRWATNFCLATTLSLRFPQCLVAQACRLCESSCLGHAVHAGGEVCRGRLSQPEHGGDGLAKWTKQDRPIENTDVVLWYTFGHTHIPRPEDYPVMPTAYIGFLLKPNGFFSENPANDVPPSPSVSGNNGCKHC